MDSGPSQHLRDVAELMWDRDSVSFDLLTYVDAAEHLGIELGTLKSRPHALKKLFRQHFSEITAPNDPRTERHAERK